MKSKTKMKAEKAKLHENYNIIRKAKEKNTVLNNRHRSKLKLPTTTKTCVSNDEKESTLHYMCFYISLMQAILTFAFALTNMSRDIISFFNMLPKETLQFCRDFVKDRNKLEINRFTQACWADCFGFEANSSIKLNDFDFLY
uniref:Uncharacterized protein n=1 Tax=Glossina brevipalpis TaxID=37001 RepID=A0A1A9W1G4_9MUSC